MQGKTGIAVVAGSAQSGTFPLAMSAINFTLLRRQLVSSIPVQNICFMPRLSPVRGPIINFPDKRTNAD